MEEGFESSADFGRAVAMDHEHKIQLRGDLELYYETKRKEHKLDDTAITKRLIGEPNRLMDRDIIYAHKDFDRVLDASLEGEEWAVVSGLNPSGPLHFGHKAMFDVLLWMQRTFGATVYIPITNDETYLVHKSSSLAESRNIAYTSVIPSIIALGFDPLKTHIFVHSDFPAIHQLALHVSRYTTYNNVRSLFGWTGSENPGIVYYMGALQFASILLPQVVELGGPKRVVVPVGIDQHPYVALARDVAHKLHITPPAEVIWKFLPGLRSPELKMSSSDPDHALFLDDSPDVARRKIRRAFSGGSANRAFHERYGAVPEVCSIFNLLRYNFLNDDEWAKLSSDYSTGKLLTSKLKQIAETHVLSFLEEHAALKARAESLVDNYIIKLELTSLTKYDDPFTL